MKRTFWTIGMCVGLIEMMSPASCFAVTQSVPQTSAPAATTPATAPASHGAVLPLESHLTFVLDTPVTSRTAIVGQQLRAHILDGITLNGVTLAKAGEMITIRVTGVNRAESGDIDGALDLFFEPLDLGQYGKLPIRAAIGRVTIVRSAGKQSTAGVRDTAGDIFIPYYMIYHYLRKGQDVNLAAGTWIRAYTGATIDATDPKHVSITAPPPMQLSNDQPYSPFTPIPFRTPAPTPTPRPKLTPTPAPTLAPSASGEATSPNATPTP